MSFKFQCWTDGAQEFFRWEANTNLYTTKRAIKKDFDFTQSLLEFIDLNMDDSFDICNQMGETVQELYKKSDADIAPLRISLDKLAERHIYFQFLRLQWFEKLDAYLSGSYGDKVYNFMRYKGLTHIPMNTITAQNQVRFLLDKVLDKDANQEKSVQKGIARSLGQKSSV
jgi:hypothetical protein